MNEACHEISLQVAPLLVAVLAPLTVLVHLDQISNPAYPEEVFC